MRRKSLAGIRHARRLLDDVYREMYLLEANRPGSEMGLALALVRAWIRIDTVPEADELRASLRALSPICLEMIEDSLANGGPCFKARR